MPPSYHRSENSKSRNRFQKFWHQDQTDDLIAEREIYVTHEIYGESYESHITTGKYLWNPDIEDFTLYLKSVNQLSANLLEQALEHSPLSHEYSNEKHFSYHQELFHILTEHYMDPYDCLQKLLSPRIVDSEGRKIFRFRAHLGGRKTDSHYHTLLTLSVGDNLYPHALQSNRLLVRTKDGKSLGHLSLEKDAYYLCLIPLFKNRQAQIRMHVRSIPETSRSHHADIMLNVDLDVRVNSELIPRDRKAEANSIQKMLHTI